jgi:hypothetical protein
MTGNRRAGWRGKAAAIGAALIGVLVAGSAAAYTLEGPRWGSLRVNFDYIVSGTSNSAFSKALWQALVDWNQESRFKFYGVARSANPCNTAAPNGAAFGASACGQAFGSGVLAITMYTYDGNKHFLHAGTVFNSHVNFSVYSGPLRYYSTDFRRVAVHEMGHALGLGHQNNFSIPAIMQPYASNIEKPQTDDINGIRALYGAPS